MGALNAGNVQANIQVSLYDEEKMKDYGSCHISTTIPVSGDEPHRDMIELALERSLEHLRTARRYT